MLQYGQDQIGMGRAGTFAGLVVYSIFKSSLLKKTVLIVKQRITLNEGKQCKLSLSLFYILYQLYHIGQIFIFFIIIFLKCGVSFDLSHVSPVLRA